MSLDLFGWNSHWQQLFDKHKTPQQLPGRITSGFGSLWQVATSNGIRAAIWQKRDPASTPSIGDWVVLSTGREHDDALIIERVLSRKTMLARKRPGEAIHAQIMAVNIDVVFVLTSLNADFKLSRIERYLIMIWQSGAKPVIVLTKSDTCEEITPFLDDLERTAIGVPIHVTSAAQGKGLDALKPYFENHQTVCLVGSSGVGKSSLINAIAGKELMRTGAIRQADQRGRHTTTHRELLRMPTSGLVIDSPGIRELQLWDDGEGMSQAFTDIETLGQACFFRDCQHRDEPNCAVQEAVRTGTLPARRLENYRKLAREMVHLDAKRSTTAAQARKRHDKNMSKLIRKMVSHKRKR